MCVTFAFFLVACSSSRNAAKGSRGTTSTKPWVSNTSKPYSITRGLQNRHLTVWASHGRYYKADSNKWEWQRPYFFCTNEDLFTQTFVVPYIIPMLERAGANVFTPRERDWQPNEFVVDNDYPQFYCCVDNVKSNKGLSSSKEYEEGGSWKTVSGRGFANPKDNILASDDLPFSSGTARSCPAKKKSSSAYVAYSPSEDAEGDYAVYVSYKTLDNSIDDAHYTVWHDGQPTEFRVNQQIGGGTWVYLGTFHFSFGSQKLNAVVLENDSRMKGVVTTDAVRFGGGMGSVVRGTDVSGLPRCDEGARYYCQWAGAPRKVYSNSNGADDYKDDINVRSLMLNWLSGGSSYNPNQQGLKVPVELSVAFHSDAGYYNDFSRIYGSLGIRTTDANNRKLANGESRELSTSLMDSVLNSVNRDMKRLLGQWNVRSRYDKNYSETRLPAVPSTILEILSHQSFPDMKVAHDPYFKFHLSRAVYKAILRNLSAKNKQRCVVAPLAPVDFASELSSDGKLTLSWAAQTDPIEPTADPSSYLLYTAKDDSGFDNGTLVKSNRVTMSLEEGRVYRFRVSALNDGGESFPSEELAAVYREGAKMVLVVNAFHRLASPQVVDNSQSPDYQSSATERMLGFDMTADPGLSYGKTVGWAGYQKVFFPSRAGGEGPGSFGFSGSELEGQVIAGNDFNDATIHVKAIASTMLFSAVSTSSSALNEINAEKYPIVDLILGNERDDGYSLLRTKALTENLQTVLSNYYGSVFASGSYIASDSQSDTDKLFLQNVFNVGFKQQNRDGNSIIRGMGTELDVWRTLNPSHYASTASDVLVNLNGAFPVLAYSDGTTAAVASNSTKRKTFVMGFPFECIKQPSSRNSTMKAILTFLL